MCSDDRPLGKAFFAPIFVRLRRRRTNIFRLVRAERIVPNDRKRVALHGARSLPIPGEKLRPDRVLAGKVTPQLRQQALRRMRWMRRLLRLLGRRCGFLLRLRGIPLIIELLGRGQLVAVRVKVGGVHIFASVAHAPTLERRRTPGSGSHSEITIKMIFIRED